MVGSSRSQKADCPWGHNAVNFRRVAHSMCLFSSIWSPRVFEIKPAVRVADTDKRQRCALLQIFAFSCASHRSRHVPSSEHHRCCDWPSCQCDERRCSDGRKAGHGPRADRCPPAQDVSQPRSNEGSVVRSGEQFSQWFRDESYEESQSLASAFASQLYNLIS